MLNAFSRWPTWMWANWEIAALASWMRDHNARRAPEEQAGFYGLDVYSLWDSMQFVMDYLQDYDGEAYEAAKEAYLCFQPYNQDEQAYARATRLVPTSCEDEVIDLLRTVRARTEQTPPNDGEAAFNARQNAEVTVGAERYYRKMVMGGPDSWNVRDHHMIDTLDRLPKHHGPNTKAIIWEHNTHIGDARATPMASQGMVNTGQLARQRYGHDRGVVLVGFGAYQGTVIAGDYWGAPMEEMPVPQARSDSWEAIFHNELGEDHLLIFPDDNNPFSEVHGHRAIGVVYNPAHEWLGNYVPTSLSNRYDAFITLENSEALHPMHIETEAVEQPPQTYPWAV